MSYGCPDSSVCHAGSNPVGDANKNYPTVPAVVCIKNGLTVTFLVAVVSQDIPRPDTKNCPGFASPLVDSRCLRSDLANQGLVVQSSVSLITSLIRQLVKYVYMQTTLK